ncbi:MAG: 1,4-beta cellobiohydrolase [Marmoricola sp.]|nr:1,4-beta cellobiohydrolase [Marmoricola sp.]
MRTRRRTAPLRTGAGAVLASLVLLFSGALSGYGPSGGSAAAGSSIGLRVVGNQLTRDGYPFLPRGFNLVGLLAPAWCTTGQGPSAAAHFGQTELDAAKAWNANTLRFQVSQRGLADPAIAQADRDVYLQRVVSGVQLARSNGFVVIVSMQDQSNGCGPAHPLPTAQTASAWDVLAPVLMSDSQVVFELFNEPGPANTAASWLQWKNGGATPSANQGAVAVGHQALVDRLRSMGATNVLIADGLSNAGRLAGMPLLEDEIGQLMYGVHPYTMKDGVAWWDQQWGYLTPTAPVIATEWNYQTAACNTATVTLALNLLPYLRDHNIGLLAHAFDIPGHTITNDWSWSPTDCATAQGGSGQLTKDYFASQTDGPAPLGACPGLTVLTPTPTRVQLRWGAANGPVDSYQVYRDGAFLTSIPDLHYSDASVEPTHSYAYSVRAVDAEGNEGPLSAEITVTTPTEPDTTLPTAPTGLRAQAAGPTTVDLTWEAATDENGVVAYEITRGGTVIDQTSDLAYSDTSAAESTTYTYTVAAVDAAGNVGPASDPASATTPAAPDTLPPSVPALLTATAPSGNQVRLTWQASSDNVGVTRYLVSRNGAVPVETTQNSYTDASLQPGATYDYVVRAVDAAGNTSPASNTVRVVNPMPPDRTVPITPKGLAAILQSPTRAALSWLASTDNVGVTGYRVIRDGATIATTTSLSYVDTAMPKSSTHVYVVRALDRAGNVSLASTGVTVIAPNSAANGLTGNYYDTTSFTTLKLTRVDGSVDFTWPLAPVAGMGNDTFTVRWTGRVIPRANEVYTFYTQSDDGVRLWVNGQQLINSWTAHASREDRATITLKATQSYTIQVDFRDNTGSALARLSWSSPTVAKAVVPAAQLLAK